MNGMNLMERLRLLLKNRSAITKEINALNREIAVTTGKNLPATEVNPMDFADEAVVAVLNPAVPFINSGGRLQITEDHTANRHEYVIRLSVEF